MAKELIILLDTVLSIYVQHIFFSNHEKNFTKNKRILIYIVCGISLFASSHLVFLQSSSVIIFSLLQLFLFSFIFKSKIYMKILSTTVIFLMVALPEIVVALVTNFLGIEIADIHKDLFYYTVSMLTCRLITYAIAKFSSNFLKKEIRSKISLLYTFPLPLASVLVLFLIMDILYVTENSVLKILMFVASISLMFANISIFYFIDKQNDYIMQKEKLLLTEKHLGTQKAHYEALYAYQNELRAFRHDSKNQMLSLVGLVESGDTDTALKSMRRSLDFLNEISVVNSGNPVIDSILQAKINTAKEHNIEIKTSIKITDKIEMDEIELGILLGNIIDNAIEATCHVEPDKRMPISVKIITMQEHISVHVTNSIAANVDITNMKTVKKDKLNHGHGIKIVKSIAERNGGGVEFDCKDRLFRTSVGMVNSPIK